VEEIGVFLKLTGRAPERNFQIAKWYRKYGHTNEQLEEAGRFSLMIGRE